MEGTALSGTWVSMRAFVCTIGEARPGTPILEMKSFHQNMFHRFGGISLDGSCLMREHLALAIVHGVGVSEVEKFF